MARIERAFINGALEMDRANANATQLRPGEDIAEDVPEARSHGYKYIRDVLIQTYARFFLCHLIPIVDDLIPEPHLEGLYPEGVREKVEENI